MKSFLTSAVKNDKLIGWGLVWISFLLGLLTLYYFGEFIDESDNLVVGDLIHQGVHLYSGVFSHHFPLPYYWMAVVVALFGKSILFARLSVLLFQTATFVALMQLSERPLLVGATAFLWGFVRPFYFGHMVLYATFTSISLFAILLIALPILENNVVPGWKNWLAIAVFSLIAFLSNPLAVYAIVITLVFLFFKKPEWAVKPGLVIAAALILCWVVLALTDEARAFWENAVLFNLQVYPRYYGEQTNFLPNMVSLIVQGLDIVNVQWFDFNLFRPIQIGYAQIDAWFFTGFLYRFAVVIAVLLLLLTRKFSAAAYLYLFAVATLLIARVDFHAQAFILVALTAIAAVLLDAFPRKDSKPFFEIGARALRIMVLVMALWLGFRLVQQILVDRHSLSYQANFGTYERQARRLQKLACDLPDVRLAHYPDGVSSNWFSGLQPASKYLFMYPWVADVGQTETIHELESEPYAIVIVTDESIWGVYNTSDYLRPLLEYLNGNYYKVNKDTYLSPALHRACP